MVIVSDSKESDDEEHVPKDNHGHIFSTKVCVCGV